tara:strand:- start:69 stop:581 length:513 start_codon:yes stop_codon:yes gene_type:complete
MDVEVFDNFLPKEDFDQLQNMIVFNAEFPLYFQKSLTYNNDDSCDHDHWNWYQSHIIYQNDIIKSNNYFNYLYSLFNQRLLELKSLMRIKVNFYPHTETFREHKPHEDYLFSSRAAIFSLNTCNGFTRIGRDVKIESVSNRMLFFDGNTTHNSTTTTDAAARYNINFNYL